MRQYLETHIHIAISLILIAFAVVAGAFVADRNQKQVELFIREQLRVQEERMLVLAETTDRNGADEELTVVLKDCERRTEFESLLIKLGTLEKKDLLVAQNLFEGCGNFGREQKAIMVGKLEREFQIYEDMLALLKTLTENELEGYHEASWKELIDHEKLRSALLNDLTDIQGKIISELVRGSSVNGSTVSSLVSEAQDIGQRLIVYDRTIDDARDTIKE